MKLEVSFELFKFSWKYLAIFFILLKIVVFYFIKQVQKIDNSQIIEKINIFDIFLEEKYSKKFRTT